MHDLIRIESRAVGQETVQTVDARELHRFLRVGTAFKDWMPRRIAEYQFSQDVDFVSSILSFEDGGSGRREFYLTFDMAKELSMVERTDAGKRARQYFIECERRAKAAPAPKAMTTLEMLSLSVQAMREIEARQADQERRLEIVAQAVATQADSQLMLTRPQNAEAITHLRVRIGMKYGIPHWVVDEVVWRSPYSLKPAGMVKSDREEANGASYAVYWTKDVNAIFARFAAECEMQTETLAVHPFVPKRFRLLRAAVAA